MKINHITNLHDARYAAAEGVFAITLCADRSCHYNLPETLIAEIITWIAGTRVVLDIGEDYEQAFLAQKYGLGLQSQFNPTISSAGYSLQIFTCSAFELGSLPKLLENQYYEVKLPANFSEDSLPKLAEARTKHQIIIQADYLLEKSIHNLRPAIYSFQDSLKLPDGTLNYDEFERLEKIISSPPPQILS